MLGWVVSRRGCGLRRLQITEARCLLEWFALARWMRSCGGVFNGLILDLAAVVMVVATSLSLSKDARELIQTAERQDLRLSAAASLPLPPHNNMML